MKNLVLVCFAIFSFCGCNTIPTIPTPPSEPVVDVCPPPGVELTTDKVKGKAHAICKTEDKEATGLYEAGDL